MALTPDLTGFADAQRRLRANFGQLVVFKIPVAPTYDPGEPIDPETGVPYDPFATPTGGGGYTEVTKRCSMVVRPLVGRQVAAERDSAAIGEVDTTTNALIIDGDDYADVAGATRVTMLDQEWKIALFRPDAMGPVRRWIAYLERA